MGKIGRGSMRNPEDRLRDLKSKLEAAERAGARIDSWIAQRRRMMKENGHTESYKLDELLKDKKLNDDDIADLKKKIDVFRQSFKSSVPFRKRSGGRYR